MDHFADQNHIERIRTALWERAEFGRATVMIGAGYSLNAKPTSRSAPRFPTWEDLTKRLVDELYPSEHYPRDSAEAIRQAAATSGALRLAEEYRSTYGLTALDEFLLSAIPDRLYEPGHLHRQLLRLPWSDVFTTNYDTLLERATLGLVDRKYDVVMDASEMRRVSRPRIVKLHGSFPSKGPFVFSEEQFRTYPRDHAPFVNLVQQAMMESIFCLLGFSGDDPNFLHWTGWVRDNLRDAAPQIYLCGLLDLNHAKRNLLHDRNVVPIDLTPLFPRTRWPDEGIRHAKALEWFLANLEDGKPPRLDLWPKVVMPTCYQRSADLPQIPGFRGRRYQEELETPGSTLDQGKVDDLLDRWSFNREHYPGWIVTPAFNRDLIWKHTWFWIRRLREMLSRARPPQRLRILHELNWRLDRCLFPLWPDITRAIVEVLEGVNPFEMDRLPDSAERPDRKAVEQWDWSYARMAWSELALAVLRFAREAGDVALFEHWRDRLSIAKEMRRGVSDRVRYEECLSALGQMDHDSVRKLLSSWEVEDDDPLWHVRRAALFIEIGDVRLARSIADEALAEVRRKLQPGLDDLALLSREGLAMNLVHAIKLLPLDNPLAAPDELIGRWDKLIRCHCNPNVEAETLWECLAVKVSPKDFRRVIGFGSGDLPFYPPAFQAIRFVEEAAYPLRYGQHTNRDAPRRIEGAAHSQRTSYHRWGEDLLRPAVESLMPIVPEYATGILLRIANQEGIKKHFADHEIAVLERPTVRTIYGLLDRALSHSASVLRGPDSIISPELKEVAAHQVRAALELMSGLVLRLDDNQIDQEFTRAIEYYKTLGFAQSSLFGMQIEPLFHRIIDSVPGQVIARYALRLFDLPIPGIDGFSITVPDFWPEPTLVFQNLDRPFPSQSDRTPEWEGIIGRLLEIAEGSPIEARKRSIQRLGILHARQFLNAQEVERLGQVVWQRLDPLTGLPAWTGLCGLSFLNLSGPSPAAEKQAFKAHCLKHPMANLFEIVSAVRSTRGQSRRGRFQRSVWTRGEAATILAGIEGWWENEPFAIDSFDAMLSDGKPYEQLRQILDIFECVILPLCSSGDDLATRTEDLLTTMQRGDLPVERVLPQLIRLFPEIHDSVVEALDRSLVSSDSSRAESSIQGLFLWTTRPEICGGTAPPSELLDVFGSVIRGRVRPALLPALDYARRIVDKTSELLKESVARSLLVGLEFLLAETRYRRLDEETSSAIPHDQVPKHRASAAKLAASLSRAGWSDHPTISKWVEDARNDPLPEVRSSVNHSGDGLKSAATAASRPARR
jgi:hypothetical protein